MPENFYIWVLFFTLTKFIQMKKLIVLMAFSALLSSCQSVPHNFQGQSINSLNEDTGINNLKREDLVITSNVESERSFNKFWLLFIPFGRSGKTGEDHRRERVYLDACKLNKIDGILQPKFETKKLVIPLIVISYVRYKTHVVGRGYNIKQDK
jgi:hypothetical protein